MTLLQAINRSIDTMSDKEINRAVSLIGERKLELRQRAKVDDYCCNPETRAAPPDSELVRELRSLTSRIDALNKAWDARHAGPVALRQAA